MALRAVLYLRLSLDRTGEKASIDIQERDCRELCDRQGWTVVSVEVDRDVSGYKKVPTPGLDAALERVTSGEADRLVCWKVDRLTRRGIARAGEILTRLEERGAALYFVKDGLDTSTATGELIFGILASIAKGESQNISLRTTAHHEARARKGRAHPGGSRCFGYNRDGSQVPAEVAAIRWAAAGVLEGRSLRSLAAELNAESIKTTMGNDWSPTSLGQMLRAPKLRGVRSYKGELYPGDWEPIFTEPEHLALLAVLDDPNRLSAKKGRHYLLSGMVRCGRCGGRLKYMPFHSANKIFPRYSCVRQPGKNNCGKLAASMESVDATVVRHICQYLLATRLADFPLPSDELPKLRTQLEEDQQALTELTKDRYLNRTVTAEAFEVTRKELEARIAGTDAAIRQAETSEAVDDELASMRGIIKKRVGNRTSSSAMCNFWPHCSNPNRDAR